MIVYQVTTADLSGSLRAHTTPRREEGMTTALLLTLAQWVGSLPQLSSFP